MQGIKVKGAKQKEGVVQRAGRMNKTDQDKTSADIY